MIKLNKISKRNKEYFSKTFKDYGPNVKGIGELNKSREINEIRLKLRYKNMAKIIRNKNIKNSLLDIGCGYTGFYEYIVTKKLNIEYTGIDICEDMINYANNKYGSLINLICGDILEYKFDRKFDYIICNGVLTQKLEATISEMEEYVYNIISLMWNMCNRGGGIVFNIMTSQVDFMAENLYYKSPLEMLAFCMQLTRNFQLDQSYNLYEYTVYLYK